MSEGHAAYGDPEADADAPSRSRYHMCMHNPTSGKDQAAATECLSNQQACTYALAPETIEEDPVELLARANNEDKSATDFFGGALGSLHPAYHW